MDLPHDNTIAAWTSLVRAQRVAMERVEASLKAAGLPPLAWYDVLLELYRAGSELRLHELEAHTLLAQYNMSRLAERLERAGLVAKSVDPEDARGRVLTLTDAGAAMRRAMWPVYAAAIQHQVGDRLSDGEAVQLAGLLRKLAVPAPG